MTDALTDFKPLDPGRIDIEDALEVQYWSEQLSCTQDDLMQAVGQVGNHVSAVRDWLEGRR